MPNTMTALQTLVDNGLTDDALDAALEALIEADGFEDDDDKRCCIALAWYRDQGNTCDPDDVDVCSYDSQQVDIDGCEYLVCLDEDEADALAADRIRDTLWAFNASFLSGETGLDESIFEALQDKCEGANDAVESLINGTCGLDDFIDAAKSADGRGPFISGYDSEENEYPTGKGWAYLYRIN